MLKSFFGLTFERNWDAWKIPFQAYTGALFLSLLILWQTWSSVAYSRWADALGGVVSRIEHHKNAEKLKELQPILDAINFVRDSFGAPLLEWLQGAEQIIPLLWVFFVIVLCDIIIIFSRGLLGKFYAQWWRLAITRYYMKRWSGITTNIEGASQRLQEDPLIFAEKLEDIGLECITATLKLIAFLPMLWAFGGVMSIASFKFDGSFVLLAIFLSFGGIALSTLVGWKLPGLEVNNQRAEAAFRRTLVFAEDNRLVLDQSSPNGSELLHSVAMNRRRMYCHYGYFALWSTTFGKFIMFVPMLVGLMNWMTGAIDFGQYSKFVLAFGEVTNGFLFLQMRWPDVMKMMSAIKRLRAFDRALVGEHQRKSGTVVQLPTPARKMPVPMRAARSTSHAVEAEAI